MFVFLLFFFCFYVCTLLEIWSLLLLLCYFFFYCSPGTCVLHLSYISNVCGLENLFFFCSWNSFCLLFWFEINYLWLPCNHTHTHTYYYFSKKNMKKNIWNTIIMWLKIKKKKFIFTIKARKKWIWIVSSSSSSSSSLAIIIIIIIIFKWINHQSMVVINDDVVVMVFISCNIISFDWYGWN